MKTLTFSASVLALQLAVNQARCIAGEATDATHLVTVSNLVAVIRQTPTNQMEIEAKERALRQAGETRNATPIVIEALLDHIGYRSRLGLGATTLMELKIKYLTWPAFDALVDIGDPVIPHVLARIRHGEDELPEGFIPTPTTPLEYVSGTSNRVVAKMPLPRFKPGEWELLVKRKRYSMLLNEIAGERSVELLHQAIREAEEQKRHLEKSLETVRSLKP